MKELVLGGARSGKSAYAEGRAQASKRAVVCLVTATAGDEEMARRIAMHRARRPAGWVVVEEPFALAVSLERLATAQTCVVVDCLTLWLSNMLFPGAVPDARQPITQDFARERAALLECLPRLPGQVIFVANEVGLGVVPLGADTRRFCDEAGRLNQDIARLCDRVIFMAAGLPLVLKSPSVA
jgi:adenosylcobinamide kinase / adenosylcobinamide-phosphate guanylyltransferase